jgi:c(7)-type cytochrome triheme protein
MEGAMKTRTLAIALAAAVFGLAVTTAVAQDLPRLVDQVPIQKSPDSPGQVTFNHSTHVGMQAKTDCTACHPKAFRILKADAGKRPAITHEAMDKGAYCGACHDGKKAFALKDDCTNCHKQ